MNEQPRVVVSLPLPPTILQPNRRAGADVHRVAAAKRQARTDAVFATYHALPADRKPHGYVWHACTARATFTFRTRRERDDDNLIGWIKWSRDAMAKYFLLGTSDHAWRWEPPVVVIDSTAQPGVVIEVWPVPMGEG